MSQYQLTDQAIFAAAAPGGVILSKVPGHGTDKIGIRRIDSKQRPVLYDIEGDAIKTAFGVDKYHWEDGQTNLSSLVQKASFKNHGKDTTSGSKPTYKNISVSGMAGYTAPPPAKRSLAKAASGAASSGAASSAAAPSSAAAAPSASSPSSAAAAAVACRGRRITVYGRPVTRP